MYLVRYDAGEDGTIVQGVVRVVGEPMGGAAVGLWREQVRTLAAMSEALAPAGITLRLSIDPDRPIERVLAAACPTERSVALERWLAAFTRLERCGTVQVEIVRAAGLDRLNEILAGGLPPRRGRIADMDPPLAAGGAWLIAPWRVREQLDELARRVFLAGRALSYFAHFAAADPDSETLRAARRNLLRLEHVPGVPAALLADQRARVACFARSCLTVDEYLGVDDAAGAWEWLAGTVRALWHPTASGLRWSVHPEFRATSPHEEEALASGIPAALLFGPDEDSALEQRLGRSAEPEALAVLLSWISPDPRSAAPEMPPASSGPEPLLSPAVARPYTGGEPYAFVSYSRRDGSRIAPILDRLASQGIRVWYDTGIPAGVEWDAYIEERIECCSVLLVFLSATAAASRYVSREVKYADARGKTLIPVLLESTKTPEGLRWILGPIQMLNVGRPDLIVQLEHAIHRAAGINRLSQS